MVLKVDFHVHTEASHDCESSVEEVIEEAQRKGMDAIAITDHDSVGSHEKAFELAEDKDLIIIPGIEISTSEGHLLGLNITEEVESGLSLEESIETVQDLGGIAVVPHPFQYFRHGVNKKSLKNAVPDAIEVFNSRLIVGFRNFQADHYAGKNGYAKIAGSDAHAPGLVGTTFTAVSCDNSVESIIEEVKAGRTDMHKNKTPILSFIRQVLSNDWNFSFLRS